MLYAKFEQKCTYDERCFYAWKDIQEALDDDTPERDYIKADLASCGYLREIGWTMEEVEKHVLDRIESDCFPIPFTVTVSVRWLQRCAAFARIEGLRHCPDVTCTHC